MIMHGRLQEGTFNALTILMTRQSLNLVPMIGIGRIRFLIWE